MNLSSSTKYLLIVLLHAIIGFLISNMPVLSKVYFVISLLYFIYRIFSALPKNKTVEILIASAYFISAEVFFRMTKGLFFYESIKYLIIFFMFLGMLYKGVSVKSFPYFLFLFLLIPSVFIASQTLGYNLKFRTSVTFVLSGPFCLAMAALFCIDKAITKKELSAIILYMGLPIITMSAYLFFDVPDLEKVLSGTASNFATSGGFGPNQVATALGIGMFVFSVRFFLNSPSVFLMLVNGGLLAFVSFRAIVTFSRGGVLTALLMIIAFLYFLYLKSDQIQKRRVAFSVIILVFIGVSTWVYSSTKTMGLIDKRYANQDASGKEKEDLSTGRLDIFLEELEGFKENPFFGVGASGMKKIRLEKFGEITASHNEMSRMVSEHGILGVAGLLILLFTPLIFRLRSRNNILFYSFLIFWFATINHSSMRIAAPSFIYALTLLYVKNEKHPLHRKPATSKR